MLFDGLLPWQEGVMGEPWLGTAKTAYRLCANSTTLAAACDGFYGACLRDARARTVRRARCFFNRQ